ncbi:polyamine oxidase [Reticulomyxa filosa]|uniref:Polyamine oxidase n=1 Tax=Reticulomyxa filosa TaxID=46433 RepID=X6PD41_RETFI|nr:polyamine oxidase [Reticulomyxa filosa]|eukprot:ETO36380.1 polyamine oxidase [Reticulomyxa filosa]
MNVNNNTTDKREKNLYELCELGQLAPIKEYIQSAKELERLLNKQYEAEKNRTILHISVICGHGHIIKYLLSQYLELLSFDIEDNKHWTCLHWAVYLQDNCQHSKSKYTNMLQIFETFARPRQEIDNSSLAFALKESVTIPRLEISLVEAVDVSFLCEYNLREDLNKLLAFHKDAMAKFWNEAWPRCGVHEATKIGAWECVQQILSAFDDETKTDEAAKKAWFEKVLCHCDPKYGLNVMEWSILCDNQAFRQELAKITKGATFCAIASANLSLMPNYADVIVIGAGSAGLGCAKQLSQQGLRCGRVRHLKFGKETIVDLGASWLHCVNENHVFKKLLEEELGLDFFATFSHSDPHENSISVAMLDEDFDAVNEKCTKFVLWDDETKSAVSGKQYHSYSQPFINAFDDMLDNHYSTIQSPEVLFQFYLTSFFNDDKSIGELYQHYYETLLKKIAQECQDDLDLMELKQRCGDYRLSRTEGIFFSSFNILSCLFNVYFEFVNDMNHFCKKHQCIRFGLTLRLKRDMMYLHGIDTLGSCNKLLKDCVQVSNGVSIHMFFVLNNRYLFHQFVQFFTFFYNTIAYFVGYESKESNNDANKWLVDRNVYPMKVYAESKLNNNETMENIEHKEINNENNVQSLQTYYSKYVVCAVPIACLQAGDIEFSPKLHRSVSSCIVNGFGNSGFNIIIIEFDECFEKILNKHYQHVSRVEIISKQPKWTEHQHEKRFPAQYQKYLVGLKVNNTENLNIWKVLFVLMKLQKICFYYFYGSPRFTKQIWKNVSDEEIVTDICRIMKDIFAGKDDKNKNLFPRVKSYHVQRWFDKKYAKMGWSIFKVKSNGKYESQFIGQHTFDFFKGEKIQQNQNCSPLLFAGDYIQYQCIGTAHDLFILRQYSFVENYNEILFQILDENILKFYILLLF